MLQTENSTLKEQAKKIQSKQSTPSHARTGNRNIPNAAEEIHSHKASAPSKQAEEAPKFSDKVVAQLQAQVATLEKELQTKEVCCAVLCRVLLIPAVHHSLLCAQANLSGDSAASAKLQRMVCQLQSENVTLKRDLSKALGTAVCACLLSLICSD